MSEASEFLTACTGSCRLALLPLAVVPSLVWLAFFMAQTKHREKLRNIAQVFFWGAAIALPVVVVERGFETLFVGDPSRPHSANPLIFAVDPFIYLFFGIAFVEEIGKYFVARAKAYPRGFFDEPQDAMLYLIVAALGFAAIENFTYAWAFAEDGGEILILALVRGISANVLHVVASGALGYFWALSLSASAERKKFLYTGIVLATLLHGIYNTLIIEIDRWHIEERAASVQFEMLVTALVLVLSGS
jgi:protease PrsW